MSDNVRQKYDKSMTSDIVLGLKLSIEQLNQV